MKRILLHICCAPCSTTPLDELRKEFEVVGYFYNPNIQPKEEYDMRKSELKRFAKQVDLEIIEADYDLQGWNAFIEGHEKEKEGGMRCTLCYEMRLQRCAAYAKENRMGCFTTVLSVSPHKNAQAINAIGKSIAEKYGIPFLEADFKKRDGFKLSIEKSKKYGLIRQNYCGCIYSRNR